MTPLLLNQAGKRLHQYNATTDTPEDYIYLGNRMLAKLTAQLGVPALSIQGDAIIAIYTAYWTATGATNYELQERIGFGQWQAVYTGADTQKSIFEGPDGEYYYRVRACIQSQCSGWSNTVTVIINRDTGCTNPTYLPNIGIGLPPPCIPEPPITITGSQTTPTANSSVTYYYPNASGSPIAAANAQGDILWREHYQPYGEKVNEVCETPCDELSDFEDIGYTGHEYDAETGLTYMQARYYDPVVGRFLAIDPVGFKPTQPMTFNRYSYANNNPYKFVDPDGREIVLATNPNVDDVSMSDLENVVESTMSTSEIGASIVTQLAASSKTWTITAAPTRGTSQAIAENGKAGTVTADGSANSGSDGTILLNFSEEKVWISTTPGEKGSPEAISMQEKLVHEGKHAVDYANGVMPEKGAINPNTGNPAREQRAMDVENGYRKEQNLEGTREVY